MRKRRGVPGSAIGTGGGDEGRPWGFLGEEEEVGGSAPPHRFSISPSSCRFRMGTCSLWAWHCREWGGNSFSQPLQTRPFHNIPGLCYFPAKIHPPPSSAAGVRAQRSPDGDREPRSASLCPIACLCPTTAAELGSGVHAGRGESSMRLLLKIAAGFQLPLPMPGSPGVCQPRPPSAACHGVRQGVIKSSCRPRSCLLWVVFGGGVDELLFAASPPAPGLRSKPYLRGSQWKNGCQPDQALHHPYFPPDFIILLHSFTVLSFPVLIPSGDGALLEN